MRKLYMCILIVLLLFVKQQLFAQCHLTSTRDTTICNNVNFSYTIKSNFTSSGQYQWARPSMAAINGGAGGSSAVLPAGSFPYNVTFTETLNNSDLLPVIVKYFIYLSNVDMGCNLVQDSVLITVNPAPGITVQPSGNPQTVCLNAAVNPLSIAATGTGITTTYQWYSNPTPSNVGGTVLIGATTSSYTPVTTSTGVLYYFCVVGGQCFPTVTSNVSGAITVNALPAIITQPDGNTQTICLNGTANPISVTATGTGTTYQWYSNPVASNIGGIIITGATNASFTATTNSPGTFYYFCIVSGTCNPPVVSNISGSVTVKAPPAILVQPSSNPQTICQNGTANSLLITATGSDLAYQWYSNPVASNIGGTVLAGQTNPFYTPTTTSTGTLYYFCVVSGYCISAVTSNVSGAITVNAAPTITTQPNVNLQTICQNGAAVPLSIVVPQGTGANYQWYSNPIASNVGGTILVGATNSSYTPQTLSIGTLYYFCVVGATCIPPVTSNVSGAVTVNASPTIITQPETDPQNICVSGAANPISVTVTGAGASYQWYSNPGASNVGGTLLVGATNSAYTPQTTSAGTLYYFCIVGGNCMPSVTSNVSGAITINALPSATISGTKNVCQNTSPLPQVTFTGSIATAPYIFDYNINGIPPNLSISTTPGTGVVMINLDVQTTTTGSQQFNLVAVTDSNGCRNSFFNSNATIDVKSRPALQVNTAHFCDKTSFSYTAAGTLPVTKYSWIRLPDANIEPPPGPGLDSNLVEETLHNLTYQPITVKYVFILTNDPGCETIDTLFLTINPTPKIDAIRDTTFCNNYFVMNGIKFNSASPDPSYTWTSDPSIGFGTNGIQYIPSFVAQNADDTAVTALIAVSIKASIDQCKGDTVKFHITVNPSPQKPDFNWLSLHDNLCMNTANINFNIISPNDSVSYTWSTVPPDNANISIRDTVHANTAISFFSPGINTIKVVATNSVSLGKCEASVINIVKVDSEDGIDRRKIFIKQPGNQLIYPDNSMNLINGYQWGYDSVIHNAINTVFSRPVNIQGQVYQFFIPESRFIKNNNELDTVKYTFWVLLQKGDCYSKVYYNGPYAYGRIQTAPAEDNSVSLTVFPNPNNGVFDIILKGNIYGDVYAIIYNVMGQVVFRDNFKKIIPELKKKINTINLPGGLYYVVLNSSDLKKIVTRFIIQQ